MSTGFEERFPLAGTAGNGHHAETFSFDVP
jgi:hypothetical protein